MTSQEFGALIRARREAKGLSVEELAGRFKLSARTLHAIENGVLDGLPHAVYARGFVRSYAQSAGVAPDDIEVGIEALFPRSVFEDVTPMPGPIDRQRASQKQRPGGDRLVALTIILVLLVLPVLAGWFVIANYGSDIVELIKRPLSATSSTPMPETSAPQSVADTGMGRAGNTSMPVTASASSVAPAQPTQSAPAAAPAAAAPPAVPRNATAMVPTPAATTARNNTTSVEAAAADVVPAGGNRVSVEAKAECYVQAMVDGEGARTMHVYPGQTSIFPFKKKLMLVLGNAGGVILRYNGKPYAFSGKDKERVTLNFPPR